MYKLPLLVYNILNERETNQPNQPPQNMKTVLSQSEFWNLPEVKKQQDIQKINPFGSDKHKSAFYEIKRILADANGSDFAEDYMGDYE